LKNTPHFFAVIPIARQLLAQIRVTLPGSLRKLTPQMAHQIAMTGVRLRGRNPSACQTSARACVVAQHPDFIWCRPGWPTSFSSKPIFIARGPRFPGL